MTLPLNFLYQVCRAYNIVMCKLMAMLTKQYQIIIVKPQLWYYR